MPLSFVEPRGEPGSGQGPSSRPGARRALPVVGAPPRGRALDVPHARPGTASPPRSVRISVTDRCDFACTYCRPSRNDGYVEGRLLSPEWQTMFEALRAAGVVRVRLTGGEPLIHPEIVAVVEQLSALGFEDVAVTTNASQLARLAEPLRRAGLHRLNISIDTLRAGRFAAVTRGGDLAAVLQGVDAALDAGFSPIKLNTVVLRGVNDDEIEDVLLWAWERRMVPRFLEVMPIAEGAKLAGEHLVTAAEMRLRIAHHLVSEEPEVELGKGPAKYLRARRDPSLRVGFISGTSDTYCDTCDRLRVSSTGVLRPCLATDEGVDAADAAHAGDAAGVVARIGEAWALKPDGTVWKGCTERTAAGISMRSIGG